MTSVTLTRRIKTTSLRACPQSTVLPFPSIDQTARFPIHSRETAPTTAGNVALVAVWPKTVAAAFVVIAGAMALNFLVLWIASARVIEQLPF